MWQNWEAPRSNNKAIGFSLWVAVFTILGFINNHPSCSPQLLGMVITIYCLISPQDFPVL